MIVIGESYDGITKDDNYIVLGSFDGLHMGHLTLMNKAKEVAKKFNGKSMVFSFRNHPLSFIKPEIAPKLLMSTSEKIRVVEQLGIDIFCLVDFNKAFMEIEPERFIELLCEKYNAKGIIVGFNYKFGHKNKGNVTMLQKLQEVYNFKLYVLDPCKYQGEIVSSSRIREEISKGQVEAANEMIGREYFLEGKVVHGKKLGRTIGFPTANLDYKDIYVLPKIGVYYTNVLVNNVIYKGITSVGHNPTVNGNKLTIETYILDFNEDIYALDIRVYFIERIRDEEKFNSIQDLMNQLTKDKDFASHKSMKISL